MSPEIAGLKKKKKLP